MIQLSRMTTAAVLLCGLGAAGATAAQDAPPPTAPIDGPMAEPMAGPMGGPMRHRGVAIDFEAIDADGDGSLTNAELTARATARLGTQDSNADGALDRAELIATMSAPRDNLLMVFAPDPSEARADRLLAFMGATEAGRIEIVAMSERQVNGLLAWFDENRDGAISLAESEAAPMHGPGRMKGRGHGGDRPRG